MLNYYPKLKPYSFFHSRAFGQEDITYEFITENSGIFTIEDEERILAEVSSVNYFPSQRLTIGASLQILRDDTHFHELSITKVVHSKSDIRTTHVLLDEEDKVLTTFSFGYTDKLTSFGLRYEYGKYFGRKSGGIRFGLGGAIEPSAYFYRRDPLRSSEYPVKATIYNLHVALIPTLAARFSDKISLDFKIIPSTLIADHVDVRQYNPVLLDRQNRAMRSYDPPNTELVFSVLLRYVIKEPKRRRRG